MSIISRVLIAASVVVAATAAQAQDRGAPVTTYIGGPKSHLTKTTYGSGGANAIGVDHAARSYAQAAPVRPRTSTAQTGFSGGANAIGVDHAGRSSVRAERVAPARGRNAGSTGGANAIGADRAN
jgi:hypothetical protein